MIYGKKNFIRPKRLELGFGLMWKVDDESISRHKEERTPKVSELESKIESEEFQPKQLTKENSSMEIKVDENTEISQIEIGPKSLFQKKPKQQQKGQNQADKKQQGKGTGKTKVDEKTTNQKEDKTYEDLSKKTQKKKLDKYKKMIEKYGDLDDEDRIARMKLLGSKDIKGVDQMLKFHKNKDNSQTEGETPVLTEKEQRKLELKEKAKKRQELLQERKTGIPKTETIQVKSEPTSLIDESVTKIVPETEKIDQDISENTEVGITEQQGEQVEDQSEGEDENDEDEGGEEEANQNDDGDNDSTKAGAGGSNHTSEAKQDLENLEKEGQQTVENVQQTQEPILAKDDDAVSILPSVIDQETEEVINEALNFENLTGIPLKEGKSDTNICVI